MLDIAALAKLGGVKKYNADEIFFNAGDPGHEMYIILKGRVGVYITSIDGFPIMVTELASGDFFGEMSLLEGQPRSATIGAIEDTIVLVINENNFEQVIAQQPSLAYRIMKGMSSRVRQLNEDLGQLKRGKAEERKAHKLTAPPTVRTPATQVLDNSLFPPGHKPYPLDAPPNDNNLLFDREVLCPVCEEKFKTKNVRSSKLRLDKVDYDLRQRFVDFEPLWYLVWTCPNCYYSNFNFEFKQVPEAFKKKLLEQGKQLKASVRLQFSDPRKLDEVFVTYYLMLQSLQASGKPNPTEAAKVWLRLSWLYSDAGDEEMFLYASRQALDMFKDTYYNTRRDTSVEQDQRLSLLLGELSMRIGDNSEALKFFRGAIARKGGNNTINRQAEDRISDLKDKILVQEKKAEDTE
ncbi:MAG: DUF2225 domain-containing protein [Syntrophomonas sp.]|uniref:DUF2225 domain-containing protein n=1 Tax=Syntrophomonas sp. TaxID=2053627 RepID=UPI00260B7DD0|nr:DUF2225 domain-containing protein [Syntrophomonas sp.]MDD2511032.1 DUF2225 domain-containing protein [Syntrophomonas sp.]MDD3880625.1 DUF2225 domain-containing protein [Syntrophomonas sp.]MDD4625927.1 DUF2225 domain-containing protein [Syntrophomonas sp.]